MHGAVHLSNLLSNIVKENLKLFNLTTYQVQIKFSCKLHTNQSMKVTKKYFKKIIDVINYLL